MKQTRYVLANICDRYAHIFPLWVRFYLKEQLDYQVIVYKSDRVVLEDLPWDIAGLDSSVIKDFDVISNDISTESNVWGHRLMAIKEQLPDVFLYIAEENPICKVHNKEMIDRAFDLTMDGICNKFFLEYSSHHTRGVHGAIEPGIRRIIAGHYLNTLEPSVTTKDWFFASMNSHDTPWTYEPRDVPVELLFGSELAPGSAETIHVWKGGQFWPRALMWRFEDGLIEKKEFDMSIALGTLHDSLDYLRVAPYSNDRLIGDFFKYYDSE